MVIHYSMKEYLGINLGGEGLYKQNRKAVKKEIKEKIRKEKKTFHAPGQGQVNIAKISTLTK